MISGPRRRILRWAVYVGLVLSFHLDLPTGPAIVLLAGAVYAGSILFGRFGGLVRWRARRAAA